MLLELTDDEARIVLACVQQGMGDYLDKAEAVGNEEGERFAHAYGTAALIARRLDGMMGEEAPAPAAKKTTRKKTTKATRKRTKKTTGRRAKAEQPSALERAAQENGNGGNDGS